MTDRIFGTQNITVARDPETGKLVAVRDKSKAAMAASGGNPLSGSGRGSNAAAAAGAQNNNNSSSSKALAAIQSTEVGGTGQRWHEMKARFRPLFTNVDLVEDWYNRVAPPRIKEKFRAVTKLLLAVPPERIGGRDRNSDVDSAQWHRANHILKLYGDAFVPAAHDRVVVFLAHATQAQADMFGDSLNSLLSTFPAKTHTKASWLSPTRLADAPDRERFHKVIDWTSTTAAERVRSEYVNPMDKKRFGVEAQKLSREEVDQRLAHVPAQLRMGGNKRTIGAMQALVESVKATTSARTAADGSAEDEAALHEIAGAAELLTKKKKSHLELSGGRYETDPVTGATIFQVRGQAMSTTLGGGAAAPGTSSMKERIVAASGVPSHSWKSTTKDHFPNLSHGLMSSKMDPERHPCVARTTAATCMVVPSFQAKSDMPVPSRGIRL